MQQKVDVKIKYLKMITDKGSLDWSLRSFRTHGKILSIYFAIKKISIKIDNGGIK